MGINTATFSRLSWLCTVFFWATLYCVYRFEHINLHYQKMFTKTTSSQCVN